MRISFRQIQQEDPCYLERITKYYNVHRHVFPCYEYAFDNIEAYDIHSYTDDAKFNLNVYKIKMDRCYKSQAIAIERNLVTSGDIQVFEVEMNFNMDIHFRLFDPTFVNYWRSDIEIMNIKPLVTSFSTMDIAYHAFKSLATSSFSSMVKLLDTKRMMCMKKDNKMIFAYSLYQPTDQNKTDQLLNHFLNALYEMVKVTSGRGNYQTPDNARYVTVNMKDAFDKRRARNSTRTQKPLTFESDVYKIN
ncbi:MAG: hypothetical protein ACRC4M_05240 [Mycoplasma sp.]